MLVIVTAGPQILALPLAKISPRAVSSKGGSGLTPLATPPL